GRGHEQRAVHVLGPRVAEDVVGDARRRDHVEELGQRLHAGTGSAVELAEDESALAAVQDAARPRPVAAQFTRHPTVRRAPTAAAINSSLSPFWSDTIAPSVARRGASTSRAAGVSWDFTASRTSSRPAPSTSGVIARTRIVDGPVRRSTVRPCAFMAVT